MKTKKYAVFLYIYICSIVTTSENVNNQYIVSSVEAVLYRSSCSVYSCVCLDDLKTKAV